MKDHRHSPSYDVCKAGEATDVAHLAEVPARLAAAEASVVVLHDTIDTLIERLASVLGDAGDSDKDSCTPSRTAMGERLLALRAKTDRANDRLLDLLSRLEI